MIAAYGTMPCVHMVFAQYVYVVANPKNPKNAMTPSKGTWAWLLMTVSAKAKYRGMRGLIMRMKAGAFVQDRQLVVPGLALFVDKYRTCTWCREPVDEPRRRFWHSHCMVWNYAAKGTLTPHAAAKGVVMPFDSSSPEYKEYLKGYRDRCCAECGVKEAGNFGRNWRAGAVLEHEHELAISVAVQLGRAAIMRAFCPGNLRYLCYDCHVVKTKRDRTILKYLRNGMGEPPVHVPQLKFDFEE